MKHTRDISNFFVGGTWGAPKICEGGGARAPRPPVATPLLGAGMNNVLFSSAEDAFDSIKKINAGVIAPSALQYGENVQKVGIPYITCAGDALHCV